MRILVMRPAPEAAATAEHLARLGHQAIAAPLLSIVPTRAKLPKGAFAAIAVTSANAIASLAEDPSPALADVPVFVVGARTAEVAKHRGFRNVRNPQADARGLLAAVLAGLPAQAQILYLAGRDRKATFEGGLGERGIAVTVVETYVAQAAETLPSAVLDALQAGTLDAALHYSPRSTAIFCRLVAQADLAWAAAAIAHHCISAEAAGPLGGLAASRIFIAERPDETALIATLPR